MRDSFTHVISLGYNCFPRKWIEKMKLEPLQYLPFDFIGTSAWSVLHLITHDFPDFPSHDIARREIIKGEEAILTDLRHYVRFPHDKKDEIRTKYLRRVERFRDIINNKENSILFIRLEETQRGRVHLCDQPHDPEITYITKLDAYLSEQGVTFKILYINAHAEGRQGKNMLCVKGDRHNVQWSNAVPWFDEIFSRDSVRAWLLPGQGLADHLHKN